MDICGENLPDKENSRGRSAKVRACLQGDELLEQSPEQEGEAEAWCSPGGVTAEGTMGYWTDSEDRVNRDCQENTQGAQERLNYDNS